MDKVLLGQLITELRKRQNIQQKELAEKMCLSPSTVSKWESGKNLPDIDTIQKLALLFNVPTDAMLNPELTLKELEQGNLSFSAPNSNIVMNEKSSTVSNRFNKLTMIGFGSAIIVLFLLVIFVICVYNYHHPKFVEIQAQYRLDEIEGNIYEMVVVCPINITQDSLLNYSDIVFEKWMNNEYGEEADNLRIYFYSSEENALKRTDTITTITLVK